MEEENSIKALTAIKGIGRTKAIALNKAGFSTISDLKNASVEEISAVKGINGSLAEKIKLEISQMEEDVVAEAEIEAKTEVPASELAIGPATSRLLRVRKRQKLKKPHFVQTDQHKKKKLQDTWRRPRGHHNKKRQYITSKGQMARVGFGSPAAVKGLHPSGFEEVLLDRLQDMEHINPGIQAVRISRTVGQRKRMQIIQKAKDLGLKILNPPVEEGGQ